MIRSEAARDVVFDKNDDLIVFLSTMKAVVKQQFVRAKDDTVINRIATKTTGNSGAAMEEFKQVLWKRESEFVTTAPGDTRLDTTQLYNLIHFKDGQFSDWMSCDIYQIILFG